MSHWCLENGIRGDEWPGDDGEMDGVRVEGRLGVHTGDLCLNQKSNRKLPEEISRFGVH